MERLTKNAPQGNFETMMNYVYGRDGWAYLRSDGVRDDVLLTDWAKQACLKRGCDQLSDSSPEEIDQTICDCAFLQPDCPIFLAYVFASQAVHMRSRLSAIEDILGDEYDLARLQELIKARDEGRVVVLPCKPTAIYLHRNYDTGALELNIEMHNFGGDTSTLPWEVIDQCASWE